MRRVWYKVNDKIGKKETNIMHSVDIQVALAHHTLERYMRSHPLLKMEKLAF